MENRGTKKVSNLEKIKEIKKIKQEQKRKIITISAISVVGILVITLVTIFAVNIGKKIANEGISAVFSINKEITEEKAVEKALKRFEKMGEENLTKDNLEVLKILRNEEYYYYISSPDNSLEIRVSDGKIVRENSVLVEE